MSQRFLCQALGVSRSGYYQWLDVRENPSPRTQSRRVRDDLVSVAFADSKGRDGARRIQAELRDQCHAHDVKTIADSMSRKGDCWDNACVESFFHLLKVEAIHDEPIPNREQMRQRVFEYIEMDYNRRRRHSALGYLSPENYEKKLVA